MSWIKCGHVVALQVCKWMKFVHVDFGAWPKYGVGGLEMIENSIVNGVNGSGPII